MFFESGQPVKISYKGFICSALVANTEEDMFLVMGKSKPQLEFTSGEIVEVGALHKDNTPYFMNALTVEVISKGRIYFLLLKCITDARKKHRESERKPVLLKANLIPVKEKAFWEGRIFNMSESGLLLAVDEPLCLGSEAYISYEDLSDREKRFVGVMGRVVRRHLSAIEEEQRRWNYYYGLKFKAPPRRSGFSVIC